MTTEEQNRIIADLFRERSALRKEIACLKEKIRKSGVGFDYAARAARDAKELTAQGLVHFSETADYLEISEFRKAISDLEQAVKRVKEIEDSLDECS